MSQIGALFSGLWGDPGQNFVNEQGGKEEVFGRRPDVAPFVPVDLQTEGATATASNLANYPGITELLNKLVPGFSEMLSQGTSNTISELKGEIPQDVQEQVLRSSAFKSLAGGFSGTPMGRALTARDLGITSLNLTQMGNNSAQAWTTIAEQAYSPWTVSTSEQAAQTAANNAGKQATDQFRFNVEAAPDPGAAGTFNVDAALGQQWMSFGMASLGGMGGSGGATAAVAPQQTAANTMQGGTGGYAYDPSIGRYVPANSSPDWRTNATSGAWSDERLKSEMKLVGQSPSGLPIYHFRYAGFDTWWQGTNAQELQKLRPDAVLEREGFLEVDYDLIDINLERVAA